MVSRLIIAAPSDLYREAVSRFFTKDATMVSISEAKTWDELKRKLRTDSIDVVIAHQSLVTNISQLPRGDFILVTKEPDKECFLAAITYGARGYLLETAAGDLIAKAISVLPGRCLLDPALTPWIAKLLRAKDASSGVAGPLTDREQEILTLKEQHFTNRKIAAQLRITEATVKKHVEHIRQKLAKK